MAGFLDATHARLNRVPTGQVPTVVLPSYNGARKLPVLTPLLALLLAREGVAEVDLSGDACPACGCAEPLVAGACSDCGLQLE